MFEATGMGLIYDFETMIKEVKDRGVGLEP